MLVLPSVSAGATRLGWTTFDADIIDKHRFSFGGELSKGRYIGDIEYDGYTLDLPHIQLNARAGPRAEVLIGYNMLRTLDSDEYSGSTGGDPYFFTKLLLMEESRLFPATSFIFGVVEPAANRPFGQDALEFHTLLASGKRFGNFLFDVNVGASIIDRNDAPGQHNVVHLNVSGWYELRSALAVGGEYNYASQGDGFWLDFGKCFDGYLRRERVALGLKYGRGRQLLLTVSTGLVEQSEDWAVGAVGSFSF